MRTLKRTPKSRVTWALALLLVSGCVATNERTEDGQTHWLALCSSDAACGAELECVCGHCVTRCSRGECNVRGKDTSCADDESAAVRALCDSEPALPNLCLEPCNTKADCDGDQRCVEGHCIPQLSAADSREPDASAEPSEQTEPSNAESGQHVDAAASDSDLSEPQSSDAAAPSDETTPAGSSAPISSEEPAPLPAPDCETIEVDECFGAGCASFIGWETTTSELGSYATYGCFDPSTECPENGVCALDPADNEHAVWFSSCAPAGWNPDRSSPSACSNLEAPDCGALTEEACQATAMCSPLRGAEPDGSRAFATCVAAGTLAFIQEPTCAAALDGRYLDLPVAALPADWSEGERSQCEQECFSPWKNRDRAAELPGCPCTTYGRLCEDGLGLECVDATDDLTQDPHWMLNDDVCAREPDCTDVHQSLQECLDSFEVCKVSAITLDVGLPVAWCGSEPLGCSQATPCSEGCGKLGGVTSGGSPVDVCVDPLHCEAAPVEPMCLRRTSELNFSPTDREPVLVETCVAPAGWVEVELEACAASAISECDGLDEASCVPPCAPFIGRRSPSGQGEFVACGDTECTASSTRCAQNESGDVVEFFGCVAPGYSDAPAELCQGDAG